MCGTNIMNMIRSVRQQLKDLGFRPHMSKEIESLGVHLTICQLIVVLLSIVSVVFLFVPLFYLQSILFMSLFFGLSVIFLFFGIWFWLNKVDICEKPEDILD